MALGDHDHVVAQVADFLHHVGRHHHAAALRAQARQRRAHRARAHHVEAARRLVQQQVARAVQQRACQRHLDALALGKALAAPFQDVVHRQHLGHFVDAPAQVGLLHAVQLTEIREVFARR
jgi:hypothetical protein